MWHTHTMQMNLTPKKQQKQEKFYQIQYTTIWDDPDVWYVSREHGDNQFKSYVEACKVVREFIKHDMELHRKNIIAEYRIVECIVNTTFEVLKNFPVDQE